MSILNPITDAAVLALDPALESEHRLQSLLALWYARYFSGAAFTTRALGGGSESKTFIACDFQWQEDEMGENPQRPILHTVFVNPASRRMDLVAASTGHEDRWLIEVMVKVPVNLSGTPLKGKHPEHVARRVAGQVQWLYASSEREALAVCGVNEIRVERPPVILPGTSWHMRMMTVSCLTTRQQAR